MRELDLCFLQLHAADPSPDGASTSIIASNRRHPSILVAQRRNWFDGLHHRDRGLAFSTSCGLSDLPGSGDLLRLRR